MKRSGPLGVRVGVLPRLAPFVGVFEPTVRPLRLAEWEGVSLAGRREGEQVGVLLEEEAAMPQLPCELGSERETLEGR